MQGLEVCRVPTALQARNRAVTCLRPRGELLLRHAQNHPTLDDELCDRYPGAGAIAFGAIGSTARGARVSAFHRSLANRARHGGTLSELIRSVKRRFGRHPP